MATGTSMSTAPGEYQDHKKDEALAGGAGFVGLGVGAGYLASRDRNINENEAHREWEECPSTIAPGSTQGETTADGLASSTDRSTTGVGMHNTVVGAGSYENPQACRFPLDNSNATTVGPQHGSYVDP